MEAVRVMRTMSGAPPSTISDIGLPTGTMSQMAAMMTMMTDSVSLIHTSGLQMGLCLDWGSGLGFQV